MKNLQTILILISVICAINGQFNLQNWQQYIEEIKQDIMIQYINLVQNSWQAGANFKGEALMNARRLCGTYLNVTNNLTTKIPSESIKTVPASFDSRTNWPNCQSIQTIRDQGNCGSCWAVSAAEAMSDRICIFSNGSQQTYISAENIVSCVMDGCQGGDPGSAWDYYVNNGVPTGGPYQSKNCCQPYSFDPCGVACQKEPFSPTPACKHTCQSGYPLSYNQDLHYGDTAYNVGWSVDAIQKEILQNGPVQATMTVYQDFMTYKSGVYQHVTGQELGGHAVKIIGWGSTSSGEDYWIVANSWGPLFGIDGYFWIKRGVDEVGIESGCVAGTPKLN